MYGLWRSQNTFPSTENTFSNHPIITETATAESKITVRRNSPQSYRLRPASPPAVRDKQAGGAITGAASGPRPRLRCDAQAMDFQRDVTQQRWYPRCGGGGKGQTNAGARHTQCRDSERPRPQGGVLIAPACSRPGTQTPVQCPPQWPDFGKTRPQGVLLPPKRSQPGTVLV
jgi:hypothetical protein